MNTIDYAELSRKVCGGLRETFAAIIAANPNHSFYSFALWTDDSLQFATPAANTEEGLVATVERYQKEVDPKHDTTSTADGMRWAYGDWEFFPIDDEAGHLDEVNAVLQENFNSDEDVFEENLEPLWQALLDGFLQLEKEGFFGTGDARSRVTLLLVGDLDDGIVDQWATTLNPPDVAERFVNWDWDS
ncbi:MAG: DUF4303 domain-containing protein [Planctomycetota bacterium]